MEYKLNKIDVELRQKVNDITKPGIIHRKEEITINKDKKAEDELKDEDEQKSNDKEFKNRKVKNKIIVKAIKEKEVEIEVFKDLKDKEYNEKGNFLDTRY